MRSSEAQVLAIDTGRPASGSGELEAARRELEAAIREQRQIKKGRLHWLPAQRERLVAAQERETSARAAVRRLHAERAHGARAFVDEREASVAADRLRDRADERATHRVLERDRGRGLEL
jgi:hypothetical protein